MLVFLSLIVPFLHAHDCTDKELITLPRDVLREKCGSLLSSKPSTSSPSAVDQCMYALDQKGCVFRLSNMTPGVANVTGTSLGCAPLTSSYTWASTISPANGVFYIMGGKSTPYRNLYTINITTGGIIYQPTVGNPFDTSYFIAADQRPGRNRLYGAWNDAKDGYRLAEIDPKTGQPKQWFAPVGWTPVAGLTCSPSCGLSTNCGYFSVPDSSYVTSWSCSSVNAIVRVNVDTLRITVVQWTGSYSYFIVNSATGIAYASTTAYSVSRINEPKGTLTTVITIPNQNVVLMDLTVTPTGVCFARSQDIKFGRAHPQAEDFVCFCEGAGEGQEGSELYSVPFMDQYSMPYATQSIMGSC